MQISSSTRNLLLLLLLFSICFIETDGKGGRGGGSRGRGSSTRYRRPTSRPAPRATYRPAPAPAPRATYRPAPAPKPSNRPPAATAKSPASNEAVVAKQPAENPNFKETNQGSSPNKQNSNVPGGPPPPYSPGGQPAPSAPVGPPPAYHPNQPSAPVGQPPPYGAPGQHPPYSPSGQSPPYPVQPPSYPGLPGRPPSYPGQAAPYPVQPGGGIGSYPGGNRPYPVQPGMQPGANRPYPVQPGGYPGSYPGGYPGSYPGGHPGSYPGGYPGSYPGGYPGGQRPYPQQPLGGNVWHPQSGKPAPAYMNYGGLPTGTNMYSKPHKQKGFLGSLMSFGGGKHKTKNKYHGSHPSPYGAMAGGALAGGGLGYMAGRGMGKMGGVGSFLGRHKSAAMFAILPFMAMRMGSSLFRPSFGMPFFGMPHMYYGHHYGHHYGHGYTHYYDIYDTEYAGKCARPLKKQHQQVKCKSDYKKIECQAKCDDGYIFSDNVTLARSNKCWHVTGVWVPDKNFPVCSPVCEEDCENGGICTRPGFCSCPDEFRGDRCQFLKSDFLDCDFRVLTKGRKVGWVCTHSRNETTCRVRCKSPGVFEVPPAEVYKCTPGGKWTPDALPFCVEKG